MANDRGKWTDRETDSQKILQCDWNVRIVIRSDKYTCPPHPPTHTHTDTMSIANDLEPSPTKWKFLKLVTSD